MIRKLILMVLAMFLVAPGFCQESASKNINKIKRNTQYLYAEATMKNPEEAYNTALELLNTYIDEYVQSKRKYESSENIIIKDIESKSERIQMKRGEMTRVFIYVKKSDIIPAENSTLRENAGKKEEVQLGQETQTEATDSAAVVSDASLMLSNAWQQEVINQLLECNTIIEAKSLLNRQKTEFRVKKSGTPNSCRNKAECFWVIGDPAGKLVTVLGPGSSERTNFRTLQPDVLENYTDATAIWFIMAE